MPIVKVIRKRNIYEKENVNFQGFWAQDRNICREGFSEYPGEDPEILKRGSTACWPPWRRRKF